MPFVIVRMMANVNVRIKKDFQLMFQYDVRQLSTTDNESPRSRWKHRERQEPKLLSFADNDVDTGKLLIGTAIL